MSEIKIIRENNQFDEIVFSFRYLMLTEKQKNELAKEISKTNTKFEIYNSDQDNFILILDLDESLDAEKIKELNNRLVIEESNYGLYVSLTSNFDHCGISFPKYIVDLIKTLGGNIDISVIMT